MHTGFDLNEHGVMSSTHTCDTCGVAFSVCPAVRPETPGWECCLSPDCASYDPSRDVDKMLEEVRKNRIPVECQLKLIPVPAKERGQA